MWRAATIIGPYSQPSPSCWRPSSRLPVPVHQPAQQHSPLTTPRTRWAQPPVTGSAPRRDASAASAPPSRKRERSRRSSSSDGAGCHTCDRPQRAAAHRRFSRQFGSDAGRGYCNAGRGRPDSGGFTPPGNQPEEIARRFYEIKRGRASCAAPLSIIGIGGDGGELNPSSRRNPAWMSYKLSRRFDLARRTAVGHVTGRPADGLLSPLSAWGGQHPDITSPDSAHRGEA